ncbi:MAG: hypothetical protein ABIP93_10155 [Gemmatimonadaceae bacterium]
MKRLTLLAIPAAAMAVLGLNTRSAAAETPSQYWQQCRSSAYSAYYGCLDSSSSWIRDSQCYWGGVADLLACDREFADAVTGN